MKTSALLATGMMFTACLWAQSAILPPAGAKPLPDAAQQTAATGQTAPSAVVAAPPSVLRIYIDNLQGSDAQVMAGLVKQALFDSRQVVVTESRDNASLVLQGTVARAPIATAAGKRSARRPSARKSELPAAGATDLDQLDAGAGLGQGAAAASLDSGLPPLPGMDSATDLTKYRYRLDLEVVTPEGDLVWMSGRGRQALPFQGADDAVAHTLSSLIAALPQLKAGAANP